MKNLTKLVATGAVISLLGTTTAVYVSKNTEIQDRITKLYNIATGYKSDIASKQSELTAKQKVLDDLKGLLGANSTSYDDLVEAINNKATTESNTETQDLLNNIAVNFLGLPANTDGGVKINYSKDQVTAKITALKGQEGKLNEIATYLKIENWDGTVASIKTGIDNKAEALANAKFQELIDKTVATLQLPQLTDEEGNPVKYDENTLVEAIMSYVDEVNALENYINNYASYNNKNYENMTLKQKLEKMINDLTKASEEDEAQLALANDKIVALGYCPEHDVKLVDGKCPTDNKVWTGGTTTEPEGGDKGTTNPVNPPAQEQQPSGGGSTGGTTQTTTCTNCGQTYTTGTTHTCPQQKPATPDSTKLANFEKALKDNATKGISNKTINALVNDHDNYRLHANAYVAKKQADGTWVYDSEHSAYIPTKGSTPWTNIKNAYIAVFGNADLMQ